MRNEYPFIYQGRSDGARFCRHLSKIMPLSYVFEGLYVAMFLLFLRDLPRYL